MDALTLCQIHGKIYIASWLVCRMNSNRHQQPNCNSQKLDCWMRDQTRETVKATSWIQEWMYKNYFRFNELSIFSVDCTACNGTVTCRFNIEQANNKLNVKIIGKRCKLKKKYLNTGGSFRLYICSKYIANIICYCWWITTFVSVSKRAN